MATPNNQPGGNIGGIDFEEPEGSGKFTMSKGAGRGQRTFFIDWDDRFEFLRQLTGFFTIVGDVINQRFPATFPGYAFLEATSVSIEGLGPMGKESNGDFRYDFAKVDVTYEPRPERDQDTAEDTVARTLSTEETDINAEFLEFGKLSLSWNTDNVAVTKPFKQGKLQVTITHTLTEFESPTSKKSIAASTVGKVNDRKFMGVDTGKLLYMGAQESRVISSDGKQPFRVVHKFLERPEAIWNNFFRDTAQPPAFEAVKITDDVDPAVVGALYEPHEEANFNLLIQ